MARGHSGALGLNVLLVAMELPHGKETAQSLNMEGSTAVETGQKHPCVQVDSTISMEIK